MSQAAYKRVLLKLSGEALMGAGEYGVDPNVLSRMANDIRDIRQEGVQIGLVIGGGNIYRGAALAAKGMDRVAGDQMGMLATVMNGIAMKAALQLIDVPCSLMSAISMIPFCEPFVRDQAIANLEAKQVVIFSAGTGNPFFTTDTAASLRAIEIGADVMLKATKVDGIYSADPVKHPNATFYPRLSYDQAIAEQLEVMDLTAILLCRDHKLPMRVFSMQEEGNLLRVIRGEPLGTYVE